MAKKVLVVLRVSTDRQNVESQKSEMQYFCKSKGFKESEVEYIESIGASARSLNKKYLDMISQIKNTVMAKNIKAVAVWHLNRLGRRESVLNELKQWFIDNQVNLLIKNPDLSLFEQIKQDGVTKMQVSKMGSLFYSFLATSIEFDTSELMEKTRRGRERTIAMGKFAGGAFGTLYGYTVNSEGYIEVSPSESALVQQIFEMYASGEWSISRLAQELSDRGYNFRGRRITDRVIARTIANKNYLGNGKFEQIIPQNLWDKCREIGSGNAKRQPKDHNGINIASKLIKCACCGENYVKSNDQYVCYRKKFKNRFEQPCTDSPAISELVIDNILLTEAKMHESMNIFVASKQKKDDINKQISVLSLKAGECVTKLQKIEDSLSKAKEMYIDGDLSAHAYERKKENIKDKQTDVELELKRLNRERQRLETVLHSMDTQNNLPWKTWEDMSMVDDREVLRAMVKKYINSVTLHKTATENGTKYIRVDLELFNGKVSSYAYYYTLKQKSQQIQPLADF